MSVTFSHRISGYLVGEIWQPGVGEVFKPVTHSFAYQEKRWSEPGTLREHCVALTGDGDFQSCEIGAGELITVARIERGGRVYTRERRTPLECFKSIADMVRADWAPPLEEGF